MNNFKSGAGDLDFGSDDEDDATDERTADGKTAEAGSHEPADRSPKQTTDSSTASDANTETDTTQEYPYFVRRSNVTDERDVRLEAHVRESVASQESQFRTALAAELDTGAVSKTDAREFALLFAFQHPERVAHLMRDEGFGVIQ